MPAKVNVLNSQRVMAFIDGENLVMRYQDMITQGRNPNQFIKHEKDTFIWIVPSGIYTFNQPLIRATYYTSVKGDDDKLSQIANTLKSMVFCQNDMPCFLSPVIF